MAESGTRTVADAPFFLCLGAVHRYQPCAERLMSHTASARIERERNGNNKPQPVQARGPEAWKRNLDSFLKRVFFSLALVPFPALRTTASPPPTSAQVCCFEANKEANMHRARSTGRPPPSANRRLHTHTFGRRRRWICPPALSYSTLPLTSRRRGTHILSCFLSEYYHLTCPAPRCNRPRTASHVTRARAHASGVRRRQKRKKMEALKRACWFAREQETPSAAKVDLTVLSEYVARGRASLASAVLCDGREVASVSVKDASQGDVTGLPCGARTLLVDHADGSIVCRGVNKFFDVADVGLDWRRDPDLWGPQYRVSAVRKMAGFIVTLFSLDGERVEVMSKHVLAGPHVQAARELLDQLSEEHRVHLAADLFAWDVCASCECIRRAQDCQHPVLEADELDEKLVLLAIQRRAWLCEESISCASMPRLAARWGLCCAPAVPLLDETALQCVFDAASQWDAAYTPFTACPRLAEGFVLLIEAAGTATKAAAAPPLEWRRPLRLKLKTVRYVVLRAFRSLVCGDSRPPSCFYHHALAGWCLQAPKAGTLRQRVEAVGVFALHGEFEASMRAQSRVRHRDGQRTVGQALDEVQTLTARVASPLTGCPLTVVVLSGLPGAGKSTLCAALARALATQERTSPFSFVVHLSRDSVSCAVAAAHGITEQSSKHKKRHLRALVHQALCAQLREVGRFCVEVAQDGLLLFDACNATRESRQLWRNCFPPHLRRYEIVHVTCGDADLLTQRATGRANHEVLHSAAEAQQALYAVRRKFQPPTTAEAAWCVDTSQCSADEASARLLARLTGAAVASHPTEVCSHLTVPAIRELVRHRHACLLHDLLGVTEEATDALLDATWSTMTGGKPVEATSLQLRLDCTVAELRRAAAQVLTAALGDATPPLASLVAVGRTLLRRVTAALRGADARFDSPATGRMVRGHNKWLRGWLLRGRGGNDGAEVAQVDAALRERFEAEPLDPHVTLLHWGTGAAGTRDAADALSTYLAASGLRLGEDVRVHVTSLLLDRLALCFGVRLATGQTTQGPAEAPSTGSAALPLHITVGTALGVAPAYAGDMAASFASWAAENAALAAEQHDPQRAVHRSQRKYHNFVEYALGTELTLRGTLELSPSSTA